MKKRLIVTVLIIAVVIVFVGSGIGGPFIALAESMFPNPSDGMKFAFQYLEFIGVWLVVRVFLRFFDKEVYCDILPTSRKVSGKRMKGNTVFIFLLGLLIGAGTNSIPILGAWLNGDLHFVPGNIEWAALLFALFAVYIQCAGEEYICRWYILGSLKRGYPEWVGILVNTIFFTLFHVFNPGISVLAVVGIIVLGLLYSLCVVYLDSLWLPIAMHTTWNYTQSFIFGLPNSGIVSDASLLKADASLAKNSFFYDTVFGVESTWCALLVNLALMAIILLIWKSKQKAQM